MATITERELAALQKNEASAAIFDRFVNGGEAESINTANGTIPTIAKFLKDEAAIVEGQAGVILGDINQVKADARASAAAADSSADSALLSKNSAQVSANTATNKASASEASRLASVAAKDLSVAAKNDAEAAAELALLNSTTKIIPLRDVVRKKLSNHWANRASSLRADLFWTEVCEAGDLGYLCAVGFDGTFAVHETMTSEDGESWESHSVATHTPQFITVCRSKELGIFCASSATQTEIFTSVDGKTAWTPRSGFGSGFKTLASLIWVSELSLFVACGYNASVTTGYIYTSPDGITWTLRFTMAGYPLVSVCWSPQLSTLIAVSNSASPHPVFSSTDAFSWVQVVDFPIPVVTLTLRSVSWLSVLGKFCVIGRRGSSPVSYVSVNGNFWNVSVNTDFPDSSATYYNIKPSESLGVFIAAGTASAAINNMVVSTDGLIWKSIKHPDVDSIDSVIWADSIASFIALQRTSPNSAAMSTDW